MDNIKNRIENVEGELNKHSFAYQLLEAMNLTVKRQFWLIVGIAAALVISNMIWLYVFQSYDYVSTSEYEAAGVVAIIESDGNIISYDITPEMQDKFTEWWKLYGDGKNERNQNPN